MTSRSNPTTIGEKIATAYELLGKCQRSKVLKRIGGSGEKVLRDNLRIARRELRSFALGLYLWDRYRDV